MLDTVRVRRFASDQARPGRTFWAIRERGQREKGVSRPVSRVLYGPGRDIPDVAAIPLGRLSPTVSSNQPGQPAWKPACDARLSAPVVPIRFCSRWGLPCRPRCRVRGALLPHPFTLTPGTHPGAVCFLWRCPWGCPRRTLSGTVFPWSPDFPPRTARSEAAARPADIGDMG